MHPSAMSQPEIEQLIRNLLEQTSECEWLEFKANNHDAIDTGEYISALANSAALMGQPRGYLVWGIRDRDHGVVGTKFDPSNAKARGNEDYIPWLCRLLRPQPRITIHAGGFEDERVVVLEIEPASHQPVQFKGEEFIRVGSYKKRLKDYPQLTRQLWKNLDETPFEYRLAKDGLSATEALNLLDYASYFELQRVNAPFDSEPILDSLVADRILIRHKSARLAVTNLGALLFAKKLSDFPTLERKAARVIKYKGTNKIMPEREQEGVRGYASGFKGLISYIDTLVPRNEVIEKALRREVPMYPATAIRELVANALIHQDLSITGAAPVFELYDDRIEVTNPGAPLIEPTRFIDTPPVSRNEKLATMMRRCHLCEERGSGWDRIAFEVEVHQLPAPQIRVTGSHTAVTLYSHKPLRKMDREDRIRAVYLHACLKYVTGERITNSSVRHRFGLKDTESSTATSYIREAQDEGWIVPHDPSAGRKAMQYVPAWAKDIESKL
jgi:ATP-dependent DNA helicase RecG